MLPGMTVINTCDYNQTKNATIAIANHIGPVYLRFGRPKVPNFTDSEKSFEIGKAIPITQGNDVSIFSTGHTVWEALEATNILKEQGIECELINIATIKPLDQKTILESIKKTKCIVTTEEHQILGGLGCSIAQLVAKNQPTPIEFVGVDDSFGESVLFMFVRFIDI